MTNVSDITQRVDDFYMRWGYPPKIIRVSPQIVQKMGFVFYEPWGSRLCDVLCLSTGCGVIDVEICVQLPGNVDFDLGPDEANNLFDSIILGGTCADIDDRG